MEPTTIAIDLAKRVFQIHYVEPETGAIHSKVLKRAYFGERDQRFRMKVITESGGT
ncbi:transposase [Burkholderia metallica]|nr:transposase [Burkholderia metallica]